MKLVGESPGISASEIASKMKIKPNYLYRVLAELEKRGQGPQGRPLLPPGRLTVRRRREPAPA